MPRSSNPFIFHTILGIGCLAIVLFLLPADTALWRRVFAGILSIGFGYHLATAILFRGGSKAARIKIWLDGLAFPILIAAFQLIPGATGWILVAAGILWRHLVARLFPSE